MFRAFFFPVLCIAVPSAAIAQVWNASLSVTLVGDPYPSSSSLHVSWDGPADVPVTYFQISAEERRSTVRLRAASADRETTIAGLKASTAYTLRIRACMDDACESFVDAEPVAATTPAEYWRIEGTGASYATAAKLVSDGNIGSHAFRYGPWAGAELDGKIQLYYTPLQRDEKGIKIGRQRGDDPFAFEGMSGFGLSRACGELPPGNPVPAECVNPQGWANGVALFQAVPLAGSDRVRLFFEAPGRGGRTRIVYLDSQDGYLGRDFHRGEATRCASAADYAAGGGCEPALAIGVDIDGPEDGNPNLLNARQFKIGYPTADSTAWDQAPGTFMWFTTEWRDRRCSQFDFNAAYAVWSGTRWQVQYGEDGCPKVLAGVQAPAPVHIGGARYKLYFSRHRQPGGPGDPRVAIKPMQMLYSDGVKFEDWELLDSAREIHFLWPDGTRLTEDEESRLDDFVVLAPGSDPARLIMYSDMSFTGLNAVPFIGSATLVNP